MVDIKLRVMVLGILAAFGIGLIGGYLILTEGLFSGGRDSLEDTSIFVSTANLSSENELDNAFMNMEFQQKGQVIGNVNIPLNQQAVQVGQFNNNDLVESKSLDETFFILSLPVNISGIDNNLFSQGNVLFCNDGASLVVLDSGDVLFLDFGLNLCDIGSYQVVGFVGDDIKSILVDEDFSLWEKQFAVWHMQGLDLLSLNVSWTKNIGVGFDEVLRKIKEKEAATGKPQSIFRTLQDAEVETEFESRGYEQVKLSVSENKVTQSLLVERGFALENNNKGNQNLAFGEAVLIYLPKGESKSFFVRSYCINAGRGVPSNSDKLNMWQNVLDNVQQAIDQNYVDGQVSSGVGQSKVWEQTG